MASLLRRIIEDGDNVRPAQLKSATLHILTKYPQACLRYCAFMCILEVEPDVLHVMPGLILCVSTSICTLVPCLLPQLYCAWGRCVCACVYIAGRYQYQQLPRRPLGKQLRQCVALNAETLPRNLPASFGRHPGVQHEILKRRAEGGPDMHSFVP